MQLFYTDVFVLPLPAGHRFPMEKYSRLREALLASGEFSQANFHLPHAATDAELARAHDLKYIHAVSHGQLEKTANSEKCRMPGQLNETGSRPFKQNRAVEAPDNHRSGETG